MITRLERLSASILPVILVLCAVVAGARLWAWEAERMRADLPQTIALPDVPGWHEVTYQPQVWWQPRASGANHRLLGSYADAKGRRIDVSLALYAQQAEGSEAGAFGEGALVPGDVWRWQAPAASLGTAKADRLRANTGMERVAYTWYRHGDLLTGSNMRLKLANIAERLLLQPKPTATLILSAEEAAGSDGTSVVADFLRATGDPGAWIDRATQDR